jgi:hypothetical protein
MTLQSKFRRVAVLTVLFTVGGLSAHAQRAESNVPAGIRISKDLGRANPSAEINITVQLKLNDKTAFDAGEALIAFQQASKDFGGRVLDGATFGCNRPQ